MQQQNERLALLAKTTNDKEVMGRLYLLNSGLLYEMARDLHVLPEHVQDFLQLCYEATEDAVRAYDPNKSYPYISYLRRCAKYRYYCYRLDMLAPLRLTRTAVNKSMPASYVGVSLEAIPEIHVDFDSESIEQWFLRVKLWQIVHEVLDEEQSRILVLRYVHRAKYAEIATELNIPPRRVRYSEGKSLSILKQNTDMQALAHDYFGLC